MKIKIGVVGSAEGPYVPGAPEKAYELGRQIALQGCILVTGACPGLPHEAIRGAKSVGGITLGISPGLNLEEHIVKYESPVDNYDILIFTGSGLMGREITAVRTCDAVIIVGGRSGTLGEFAIAYDEGKIIGVLFGTGGLADNTHTIVEICNKETGATLIYESDPKRLVERVLRAFDKRLQATNDDAIIGAYEPLSKLFGEPLSLRNSNGH
jgi:uncharacterized protein (TIGR00725 family)